MCFIFEVMMDPLALALLWLSSDRLMWYFCWIKYCFEYYFKRNAIFFFFPPPELEPGCAPHQLGQHLPERSAMGGCSYSRPHGSRNRPTLCREPLYPCQRLYNNGNDCCHIFCYRFFDLLPPKVSKCFNRKSRRVLMLTWFLCFLTTGGIWESYALVRVYFEAAARVRPCQRSTKNHSVLPAHQEGTPAALNYRPQECPPVMHTPDKE